MESSKEKAVFDNTITKVCNGKSNIADNLFRITKMERAFKISTVTDTKGIFWTVAEMDLED